MIFGLQRFECIPGLIPVPYISEIPFNGNALAMLKIRAKYVVGFYLSFFGFIFIKLMLKYLNIN